MGDEPWNSARFETDFAGDGGGEVAAAAEAAALPTAAAAAASRTAVPSLPLEDIDTAIDKEMGNLKACLLLLIDEVVHAYQTTPSMSVQPSFPSISWGYGNLVTLLSHHVPLRIRERHAAAAHSALERCNVTVEMSENMILLKGRSCFVESSAFVLNSRWTCSSLAVYGKYVSSAGTEDGRPWRKEH